MKKRRIYIISVLIVTMLLCSCSLFKPEEGEETVIEETNPTGEEAPAVETATIHIYFGNEKGTALVKEIREIDKSILSDGANAIATEIVTQIIKGTENKQLKNILPSEFKLMTDVTVDNVNRCAKVDLSKRTINKIAESGEKEKCIIYSIVNSLTELIEVESVQFLMEGAKITEYKGNVDLKKALTRDLSLIIE